jgi:hypothetical protein
MIQGKGGSVVEVGGAVVVGGGEVGGGVLDEEHAPPVPAAVITTPPVCLTINMHVTEPPAHDPVVATLIYPLDGTLQ